MTPNIDQQDCPWPGAPIGWEPEEVDPRGLLDTGRLRLGVVIMQSLVAPSMVVGWLTGALAIIAAVVATTLWSAAAAENARRARPSSPQRTPPGPLRAARWWSIPVIYTVLAALALTSLAASSGDAQTASVDDDVILVAARIALIAGGFVAWCLPYRRLASVARWSGASSPPFRRWFWLPTIVSVVMVGQLAVLSFSVHGGWGEQSDSSTLIVAASWLAALAISVVLAATGRRAMLEMDGAAKELYQKRSMPPLDPAEFLARRERLFGPAAAEPASAGR